MPTGDPFRKLISGERLKTISGAAWNAFIESTLAHRNNLNRRTPESQFQPEGIVYVLNDSGGDLSRFAVLGIDSVIFTPDDNLTLFQNEFAFVGVTPTTDHSNRFVILYEPIVDGKIGLAYVFGVCPVTIDMLDPDHHFAELIDGAATGLQSTDAGGVEILYVEPGSGASWGIVRLGGGGGAESVGQYLGMSHLNVSDNTMGHDWLEYVLPVELEP